MADTTGQPDFGYTIRVDGFAAIATEAKTAEAEIAKVDTALKKLATGGGATPFNAVEAARARAAANAGRTFTAPTVAAGGAGGLSYAALPDDSATRIGTSTAAWEKYETAANSAALATGNAAKAAGGLSNFQVGAVAVGAAAAALNFAGESLAEFSAKEKEIAQLAGQLKSLGDGAKVSAEDIANLAEELQDATNIDSRVLINAASELLERNVPQEGLKGALKLTADLVGVTGNADKAVALLAQTFNGGVTQLNRYGAGLSESSTQADRLDALLRLASQGAAQNEATVNTLGGAYDRLKQKLGDFKENVGRGLESTFGLSKALNTLGDVIGGTDAAAGNAAQSIDDFGNAMRDAKDEGDGLAAAAARVTEAAREAAAADAQWKAGNRRAERAARDAANAADRTAAEQHARELREIAQKEAEGTLDAAGAKRLRDQVESARAMEETARKAADAQTELERLKRTEQELAQKAREVGEAYNALDPEQRAQAAEELRAAREAHRVAEEAVQDAEDNLGEARSREAIARESAERTRLENVSEQRRAAEKDAENAKEKADREKDRADKERKRNIEALADAMEKGRKDEERDKERAAQAEEAERRKTRPDGRRKITSRTEEESRARDAERMAPDQTAGTAVAEANKQRAADAKAAADAAAKTGADIVAMTQVLGGTLNGNFAAVLSALETMQKQQAELERRLSALRQ